MTSTSNPSTLHLQCLILMQLCAQGKNNIIMKRYEGYICKCTSLSSDYLNLITMNLLFSKLLVNISIQLRTEILVEATSSVIPNQQRYEYSKNMCFWNFATCKWKGHNGKIKIISFVVQFSSSLSIYMCMSSHEVIAELMISFYFKFNGIGAINIVTTLGIIM